MNRPFKFMGHVGQLTHYFRIVSLLMKKGHVGQLFVKLLEKLYFVLYILIFMSILILFKNGVLSVPRVPLRKYDIIQMLCNGGKV
jgi:hypothetical protein